MRQARVPTSQEDLAFVLAGLHSIARIGPVWDVAGSRINCDLRSRSPRVRIGMVFPAESVRLPDIRQASAAVNTMMDGVIGEKALEKNRVFLRVVA